MGLIITEIGTHTLRKGVATALTNTPGGLQAVSVWLRAGWNLGGVQGRYIFAGSGGDQFVRGASAGLNVNDASFATLPPHFHGPVLSVEQWKCIVPGYDSHYPPTFRLLVDLVLLGVMWNPVSKMMSTGIPPHVAQSDKIQTLENEVKMLGSTIQQKLDEMPVIVAGELMAQGGMSGSSQLTTSAFHQVLSQLRESILRDLQKPRLSVDPMVPAESSTTTDASSTPDSAEFLACYKKIAVSVGIPTSNDEWEARRMDEMSYLTLYRSFSTSSVPP
ncbi:hypothetical protein H257_19190 [Aphanomyces astaci]|uniref:Uncharacterized protein n=1 Tax=Aphanomyces astaci TaxID=112090 RepID=W4F8R9_APHAT|nr:hypothetical protein H257_19190 [Aphanomyces astaci]ETV63880.1 hypothetical protein H257_19190 [Aphanomyces astaci]|eukprot:XP_009846635.1 hypothetical protein H257_19190 [Aphanomyces astaci]